MGVLSIFADGLGLMFGSLLGSAGLTLLAWRLAGRLGRAWVAPALIVAVVTGALLSPLEASLLVRMTAVFALVGAALLWFVGFDRSGDTARHDRDDMHGIALHHRHDR